MVALPSDVARSGSEAKQAYQTVFRAMVDILQRGASACDHPDRTTALSIAALCAGGMIIARASDDRRLADEVRDACMTVALRLGGWDKDLNSRAPAARPPRKERRGSRALDERRSAGSRKTGNGKK